MISSAMLSALVRAILENWGSFEWTVQGIGMLRTKLDGIGRIHIWDASLRVPWVSDVHSHPWDLTSHVVSGELINTKFEVVEGDPDCRPPSSRSVLKYVENCIQTGEGGGLIGPPQEVCLGWGEADCYGPGMSYSQHRDEIHRTLFADGTVTVMERTMGPPDEKARVYWPRMTNWVSAMPRPALSYECEDVIRFALSRWSVPNRVRVASAALKTTEVFSNVSSSDLGEIYGSSLDPYSDRGRSEA